MSNEWHSVEVTVAPEAVEAIEFAMNSLDALGTSINHLRKANSDVVTVVGYFDRPPNEEAVDDELLYALRSYGFEGETVSSLARGVIADSDWLVEWKKHWRPTEVGRFIIAPPWEEVISQDKIVIRIEPNMAFGTGTHDTTQLCLKAIDDNYRPGESFLDVGTGTGILAIAAAQLGESGKVTACDTDALSVEIARENARLNGVEQIEFFEGTMTNEHSRADFVCANLTLDVILPMLSLLIERTSRVLVLSGILAEQEVAIVEALTGLGIHGPVIERSGEWLSVVVEKK